MKSTSYYQGVALGLMIVLLMIATGTAAAVTIAADPPEPAQVGERVSMTITIGEPFLDAPDQWTLRGESELGLASWTVTTIEQGRTIDTNEYDSATFEQDLDIENGATKIEITVEGTVPEMTQFNYDKVEMEKFVVARVGRATDGYLNAIGTWEIRRFTEESKKARQAISEAEAAVEASDSEQARNLLSDAKAFYANEEFERAISNAEAAQEAATVTPTQRSSDTDEQQMSDQTEKEFQRGFITNDQESPLAVLDASMITLIGFALSIVGILLELRRGV